MLTMQQLAQLPDDVQINMLEAQAEIVAQEIRRKGETYRVRRTGGTLESLRKGKVKRDKNGDMSLYIRFEGKNPRGTRYGEIAFVNNYGTSRQPARPFVTEGVRSAEQPAANAAEKIYNDWVAAQEQKG